MFSEKYCFAERPAALILGRRGFLKVTGVCVAAVAVCGYAINDMIARRGIVIKARQYGLYKDDKLCQALGLTSSHQNPTCLQIYKDLDAKPVDHLMHELLHTHYYPRTQLAAMTTEVHHG